jgi:pimeloyl-ACP methyl ester carboxylesterase
VRPTIVFFHGNGDTTAGSRVATQAFARAGYGLLLPEYRGYAGNPGSPSEEGLYKDGRAALQWLLGHGVQGPQIVLMGNSLGSGVATEMAAEHRVAALVLVSGFTSMVDVVRTQLPFVPAGLLVRDRFDNEQKLAKIGCPTLILHGEADTLIPASQGAALAAASGHARLDIIPAKGHELAYTAISQERTLVWLASIANQRPGFDRTASPNNK